MKNLPTPFPQPETDIFVLKYNDFEVFYITLSYCIELRQLYYIIWTALYVFR